LQALTKLVIHDWMFSC